MSLRFNLTYTGVIKNQEQESAEGDTPLQAEDLKKNLRTLLGYGLACNVITGSTSARVVSQQLRIDVEEVPENEPLEGHSLFPPYLKHTKAMDFVRMFVAIGRLILLGDSFQVMVLSPHAGASFLTTDEFKKLLVELEIFINNPLIPCEFFSRYEMILFNCKGDFGERWKHTFYPNQMTQVFVSGG